MLLLAVLFAIFILSCDGSGGSGETEDTPLVGSGTGVIDVEAGGSRSAEDIMKVLRQRTPGLRHVYNNYLEKKEFEGKVKLRFTIAPGGEIISISTVSSTTGFSSFDNEIKNAVSKWTFSKVKSGNTTVTVPFTFSI